MLNWLVLHVNQRLSDTLISNLIMNVHKANIYKIAMVIKSILQQMLKGCGIQLMPLIIIQLLINKTFSCTNDNIARDDDSSRLVRLVPRLGLLVRV
jgi:hypothetical protein